MAPLIAWLQAISGGDGTSFARRREFLEPLLAFEAERLDSSAVRIRVLFLLSAAPPWWDSYGGAADELTAFELPIDLDVGQLARATSDFLDAAAGGRAWAALRASGG